MKKQAELSLETAKAMYKEGGVARQFALDNFTEEELTKRELPRTWNELPVACAYNSMNAGSWPQSYTALKRLEILRDYYNDGWTPCWTDFESKFALFFMSDEITKCTLSRDQAFLAFKTPELRSEFLKNFEDLIMRAKPLL